MDHPLKIQHLRIHSLTTIMDHPLQIREHQDRAIPPQHQGTPALHPMVDQDTQRGHKMAQHPLILQMLSTMRDHPQTTQGGLDILKVTFRAEKKNNPCQQVFFLEFSQNRLAGQLTEDGEI